MLLEACDMRDEKKKSPYKMGDLGIICDFIYFKRFYVTKRLELL